MNHGYCDGIQWIATLNAMALDGFGGKTITMRRNFDLTSNIYAELVKPYYAVKAFYNFYSA